MSRNFELLTQLECDMGVPSKRVHFSSDIPVAKTVAPRYPSDAHPREILRLVQSIFLSANGSAPKHVMFCGVDTENGSATVCVSAGRTLAATSSKQVCLVDANVRSPRLPRILGIGAATPFPRISASLRDQCEQIQGNLWLAGADLLTDARGALLPVDALKQSIARLSAEFDCLLIDAPGARIIADAAILGQLADATVLVVEADVTHRLSARKAKQILDEAGVNLIGTVLHGRSFPIPESIYKRL